MTVSEQIIQVIDELCSKLGVAIDWTGETVIPYIEAMCKKLIAYEIASSIAIMVIMILLSIGSVIATKKLYKVFKRGIENQDWDECGWSVGAFFAVAALVILNLATVVTVGIQIVEIIKSLTFPELYFFEYLEELF